MRAGDRVRMNNALGTVLEIFPDGIHFVRLDTSGRIVAVLATQLAAADSAVPLLETS